jgi:hypothetical protein
MPSYIEKLEKIIIRLSKEVDGERSRVAELGKERNVLAIALYNCMTVEQMKIRDIEQQAKGVEDCLGIPVVKGDRAVSTMRLNSRVKKLKAQAKSLKETKS